VLLVVAAALAQAARASTVQSCCLTGCLIGCLVLMLGWTVEDKRIAASIATAAAQDAVP
jgi:hypothetical protein